eukprot:scaffold320774_cov43-Prasinocladus_malaysianus.AAC.1
MEVSGHQLFTLLPDVARIEFLAVVENEQALEIVATKAVAITEAAQDGAKGENGEAPEVGGFLQRLAASKKMSDKYE